MSPLPRISEGDLLPGDVLLSVGIGRVSEVICAFDGGQYSHAALWTGADVIEATSPRCVRHPLTASLGKHPRRYVDAYRHEKMGDQGSTVVPPASRYLDQRYSYGDLAMAALILGTTAWFPTTWMQEQALLTASDLNREFLGPLREPTSKLVTCTELVARAYFGAGVPIRVIPKGGKRYNVRAVVDLFKGMGELWQEADPKRSAGEARHWIATQEQLRIAFLVSAELDPEDEQSLLPDFRALSPMVAGSEWGANLVTPSYLEFSPDLKPIGRLYESVEASQQSGAEGDGP